MAFLSIFKNTYIYTIKIATKEFLIKLHFFLDFFFYTTIITIAGVIGLFVIGSTPDYFISTQRLLCSSQADSIGRLKHGYLHQLLRAEAIEQFKTRHDRLFYFDFHIKNIFSM